MYPIVEYAHKIGKSTVDFTVNDLGNFMKWWAKQPGREEILNEIQQQQHRAEAIHIQSQQERKYDSMTRRHTTASFQAAQTNRLAERGIESPINDGKEEIVIHEDEVICSMELTQTDVQALLFSIRRTFEGYEMGSSHPYTISLSQLKDGLEGI